MPGKVRRGGRRGLVWRKLSSAKWEDVWPERLSEFADRLAITVLRSAKTIRLEIFALTKREAKRLSMAFGGQVSVEGPNWSRMPPPNRAPIRIRGKLVVVTKRAGTPGGRARPPVLVIPTGMAFGTGEHATTQTALRLLADCAGNHPAGSWDMLDLGCGTGILAMAGRMLGARRVEAADHDPICVRIAKENATANGLRGMRFRRLDVRAWEPERTWPVITANLFSSLLAEAAPKLAQALDPEGVLIFSGILREQEREVVSAFQTVGLRVRRIVRKGKWVSGVAATHRSG